MIDAAPFASSSTVTFWQIAVGGIISNTVTVAEHVLELPCISVTVKTTVFAPTSSQSKLVMSNAYVSIAQLSDELLSISFVVIVAAPFASN